MKSEINLRAVLFDMDGVLYDSMPSHAEAWTSVMVKHGLPFTWEDSFLHEGRTGASTIRLVCEREGVVLTDAEIEAIYNEKTAYFQTLPPPRRIPGVYELLQKVCGRGLMPMVVTGSGHADLPERLREEFPGIPFRRDRMVTGFDVKYGKPHPEPYLMALEKGQLQPQEAIVVENAPLGVTSAHAAGLFTVAVNTGPLPASCLTDAGADLVFANMAELTGVWDTVF
jgi:HAD superfamily hydrolase (TIGR01509 family)